MLRDPGILSITTRLAWRSSLNAMSRTLDQSTSPSESRFSYRLSSSFWTSSLAVGSFRRTPVPSIWSLAETCFWVDLDYFICDEFDVSQRHCLQFKGEIVNRFELEEGPHRRNEGSPVTYPSTELNPDVLGTLSSFPKANRTTLNEVFSPSPNIIAGTLVKPYH